MQTSNFAYKKVDDFRKAFEQERDVFLYSRGNNPTVDILCKKLAAIEGAEDCLVFNSGAAAAYASILSTVRSGDHIVCVDRPYTWVQKLLDNILPRYGVSTSYIDGRYIEHFERAILPTTKLIYLECPNSWDFALQDLRAVAELAKAENISTICDNSYCTGLHQRPIEMGIDMTIQSATKYIGGHSDVVAGVVCGSAARMNDIFYREYMTIGSGIQPFNAWLLLRGLRTLPARLKQINETARQVIHYLKGHPKISEVIYPLDESFPQAELAGKQMSGAGGMLTFVMKTGQLEDIERFCEKLQHILMAVSWGGYESLVIPRCAGVKREDFRPENREHRMVRLYVGLEDPAYLIADLEQALAG